MSKSKSGKGLKIFMFLLLAAIVVTALFFWYRAKNESEEDRMFTMATNAERVEFLNEQGWVVKPDPLSKEEITVPPVTDPVYADYAALQAEQGFDLEKYQGKPAVVITYQVLNYPDHPDGVVATMMFAEDDRLIGGDISLEGEDGFTGPLISSAARTFLNADDAE